MPIRFSIRMLRSNFRTQPVDHGIGPTRVGLRCRVRLRTDCRMVRKRTLLLYAQYERFVESCTKLLGQRLPRFGDRRLDPRRRGAADVTARIERAFER